MKPQSLSDVRVLVTGGAGFLGQYVCHELEGMGAEAIPVSRRNGYDLRKETDALSAALATRPEIVIHLAGVVGGIGANMVAPATFFRDNMLMGMNVVEAAAKSSAKLVFVGTLGSYPKICPLPFKEESFWDGYPEPTNAPYGIAKKALFVMCRSYRKQYGLKYAYLVPCNLYGPCDNFDERSSHVIPALIRRFLEARETGLKEVSCWGTGKATRSFLFVHDAAKAVAAAAAGLDDDEIVNLPGGEEISMQVLAALIAKVCGYEGKISWDTSKPDGQPRCLVDGARAEKLLKWKPRVRLEEGIRATVDWYLSEGRQMIGEGFFPRLDDPRKPLGLSEVTP